MVTNESNLLVLMPLYSPWGWPCDLLWAMGHQQGWCKQKFDEHLHCGVCLPGTQMPCKEDQIWMVFLERDPKITWRVRQSHPSVLVESNPEPVFQLNAAAWGIPVMNKRSSQTTHRIRRNNKSVLSQATDFWGVVHYAAIDN